MLTLRFGHRLSLSVERIWPQLHDHLLKATPEAGTAVAAARKERAFHRALNREGHWLALGPAVLKAALHLLRHLLHRKLGCTQTKETISLHAGNKTFHKALGTQERLEILESKGARKGKGGL